MKMWWPAEDQEMELRFVQELRGTSRVEWSFRFRMAARMRQALSWNDRGQLEPRHRKRRFQNREKIKNRSEVFCDGVCPLWSPAFEVSRHRRVNFSRCHIEEVVPWRICPPT